MENFSILGAAGIAGVGFYLGSYTALQLGILRGNGYAYAILNATAAALVLLSLKEAFNLSSAVIQISWIVISLVGITRHYILTHRARFTDEEKDFIGHALPEMEKLKARRLLDLGTWVDMVPGTLLTEEGSPVSNLFYLVTGSADVISHGSKIATLQERSLVGEMTALSGEPATGTVLLNEPSRCLMIPSDGLRDLSQRDPDIRRQIDACFAGQVKVKLLTINKALSAQQVSNGKLPLNTEKTK
ncbi:Crp/Fnr family transcriptional regulator [Pseudomonadota bacterium]